VLILVHVHHEAHSAAKDESHYNEDPVESLEAYHGGELSLANVVSRIEIGSDKNGVVPGEVYVECLGSKCL